MARQTLVSRRESVLNVALNRKAEVELVAACAGAMPPESRRDEIRSLLGECEDWTYVLELCRAHGVSSLICSCLEANASDLVPVETLKELQIRFRSNACRNLFLTQELLALVQEFRKNGIDVIPFKGPMLAVTAYGNVALREFVDLDILVEKKNLGRARELLAQRGYHPPSGQLSESYQESQLGCDFRRADGRVALELHWSFIQKWLGFHVDLGALWAGPAQTKIGPVPVSVLPADVLLLYLCAHGAKHRWSRLCWVVDVDKVVRTRQDLDWPATLLLAGESGCLRTLFIGLHLAKTVLAAPVPDSVWARVQQDQMAVSLASSLRERMFIPRNEGARDGEGWNRDWFHIRSKERWRDKFGYFCLVVQLVFQPSDKDRNWVRLPRWLEWLYPALRPLRVALQTPSEVGGNNSSRIAD